MEIMRKLYSMIYAAVTAFSLGCATSQVGYQSKVTPMPETFEGQRAYVAEQMKKRGWDILPFNYGKDQVVLQVVDGDNDAVPDFGVACLRKDIPGIPRVLLVDYSGTKGVGSIDLAFQTEVFEGNFSRPVEVELNEKNQNKFDEIYRKVIKEAVSQLRYEEDLDGYSDFIESKYGLGNDFNHQNHDEKRLGLEEILGLEEVLK